jgi:predicted ArsR family transcriptional regulator
VNLANGHAFAPPFRPGPPPPTQSIDGRILAQLAQRGQASPRGLASILDIKEAFVAQTLRNLGREGRVTAADLAPGQSDRDQSWSVA